MKKLSWQMACLLVLLLIALAIFSGLVFKTYRQRTAAPVLVQATLAGSFTQHGYIQQWPLTNIDDRSNAYLVRVAVEPQIILGKVPYGDFIALAWNQGYFSDQRQQLVKVAIPRVWYKPDFHQLYFLSTTELTDAPGFPGDLFLQKSLNYIDSLHGTNQPIVGVYVDPTDESIPGISQFFTTPRNTNWSLPESFITSGSPKDLPTLQGTGVFLPATNLIFDINQ